MTRKADPVRPHAEASGPELQESATVVTEHLPRCAVCGKTIELYRIVCPLGDDKLACAKCANDGDLWAQYDSARQGQLETRGERTDA
jgi:hypothetical protein